MAETKATTRRTKPKAEPEAPATEETVTSSDTTTAVIVAETNGTPAVSPLNPNAGTYALAMLSDEEFSERLEVLKRGRDRIATIQRELMEPDVDYGLIPGTPKPTLFKSGAEKLAQIYSLAARVEMTFVPGDGVTQPTLKYEAACFLHLGSFDGPIVAVGHGTANGWEKRYRRDADRTCPDCGKTTLIVSKFEPGWYCFPKKGGCGHKFTPDDKRVTEQGTDSRGDPVAANDLQNTLMKMAEKRAFVDGVLRATASSSLFTQDVAEERDQREVAGGYDEPVETTPGGRVVNTDGEVVERRETTDEPVPETRAATEGTAVGRGGHSDDATSAQISQVKAYSKALKLGPYKLSDEISSVLGGGLDSTELAELDPRPAAEKVVEFLEQLSAADIGKLVTHLRKQVEG